jgi:hypothetical protein
MRIEKQMLCELWYENEDGEKFIPNYGENFGNPPLGYFYQHGQFPTILRHSILKIENGSSHEIMAAEMSWSEDLVLSMANSGKWKLREAILIAANACERCMNSLAHEYGLNWGYAEFSDEWEKCGTTCRFCR